MLSTNPTCSEDEDSTQPPQSLESEVARVTGPNEQESEPGVQES